jgi:hypothetical protein
MEFANQYANLLSIVLPTDLASIAQQTVIHVQLQAVQPALPGLKLLQTKHANQYVNRISIALRTNPA